MKRFKLILITIIAITVFGITGKASALEGHIDFDSSSMSYFWVWNNNAAEQWNTPTLGVPFTEGYWAINGLTFNLTLDNGINYGSYTNGKINLTLAGSGSWAVDGGNLSNVQCEVWTAAPHQLIPCTMNISKNYYQSATFDSQQNIVQWAVDYQLNFVADNKKPSYVFIRIGTNRNGDHTIIPIMNGLYSGNTVRTRPRIRNASYDYSTSDDSSSSAQLNQIIDNTSDLINGQKNIYDATNNPEWREEEREEMTNAQDGASDAASDATDEAEAQTQSLMASIVTIIDVFRNAQPSDCKIFFQYGNFIPGTMDFCAVPDDIRNMISIIVAIPITIAVLHITYTLIMNYADKVREEQK